MEKIILRIQAAFFFKEEYNGGFEQIFFKLQKSLGEPKSKIYYPVPENAPVEIPRLTLDFNDYSINIAKNRLDVFATNFDSLLSVLETVNHAELMDGQFQIIRIGYVKTYFVASNINTVKQVLNENIQKIDLLEMGLRVNKHELITGFECNNIETMEMGNYEEQKGVIITRDINTIPNSVSILSPAIQIRTVKAFEAESSTSYLSNSLLL